MLGLRHRLGDHHEDLKDEGDSLSQHHDTCKGSENAGHAAADMQQASKSQAPEGIRASMHLGHGEVASSSSSYPADLFEAGDITTTSQASQNTSSAQHIHGTEQGVDPECDMLHHDSSQQDVSLLDGPTAHSEVLLAVSPARRLLAAQVTLTRPTTPASPDL